MSAILGRCHFDGSPVDTAIFKSAMESISHYGRDGSDLMFGDAAMFGFHHFKIARNRPAESHTFRMGSFLIVADAVLDNRDELLRLLGRSSGEAAGWPDSTMILHSYAKWGAECLHYLFGDFAFAIYDFDRQQLFLARDHIGARPLYWHFENGTFVFSSDIRGLISFSDIDWEIDEEMVALYATNTSRALPKTFFKNLHFLKPGHALTATKSGIEQKQWWNPKGANEVRYKKVAEYAEHLKEQVERSVSVRVDTDLPVGSHISGGIDSSVVSALASRALIERGRELVAGYPWAPDFCRFPDMGEEDERHKIIEICQRYDINCNFGVGDQRTPQLIFERQLELDGTADLIDEIDVLARARSDNVGLLLSGWGGDEAFSCQGYGYLAYLVRRGKLRQAFRLTRRNSGGLQEFTKFLSFGFRHGVSPLLPGHYRRAVLEYDDLYPRRCFLNESLAKKYNATATAHNNPVIPYADPIDYLCRLISLGYLSARMDTWAAWSAEHNIQYRYPLTDRNVMEFCLRLPPDGLCGNGNQRYLARKAFGKLLPGTWWKSDPANEAFRESVRKAAFFYFEQRFKTEQLAATCPWIDAEGIADCLQKYRSASAKNLSADFIELYGATRLADMYKRHYECQSAK